jgi:hypothetical protein
MGSIGTSGAADPLHAVIADCRAELAGLYAEVAADGVKKLRRWQDESPMLESYIQGKQDLDNKCINSIWSVFHNSNSSSSASDPSSQQQALVVLLRSIWCVHVCTQYRLLCLQVRYTSQMKVSGMQVVSDSRQRQQAYRDCMVLCSHVSGLPAAMTATREILQRDTKQMTAEIANLKAFLDKKAAAEAAKRDPALAGKCSAGQTTACWLLLQLLQPVLLHIGPAGVCTV